MSEIVTDLLGQPITAASVMAKVRRAKKEGYASPPGSGPAGETCRSCANYCRVQGGSRAWPKCGLVKWTHGPGTDIKAAAPACSQWKPEIARTAVLSPDNLYRYELRRVWDDTKACVCFILLNPSTADATKDDATVRRCMAYARDWGFGSLVIVNLFAFRATEPKDMKAAVDPVGPRNPTFIWDACISSKLIVCAWGTDGGHQQQDRITLDRTTWNIHCLGTTKDGHPKHPLYLSKSLKPVPFVPAWRRAS